MQLSHPCRLFLDAAETAASPSAAQTTALRAKNKKAAIIRRPGKRFMDHYFDDPPPRTDIRVVVKNVRLSCISQ